LTIRLWCAAAASAPATGLPPTSAELQDGGYKMNGFQRGLGLDGEFHPEISRLVVSAAERLFAPAMA
jgi:hypothetical protein